MHGKCRDFPIKLFVQREGEARVALGSLNGVLWASCIMKQKQWNKKTKCYCCVLWQKTIKEEESFICLSMFCFFAERRGGWISHGDRFLIIKENDYFVHLSNKSHSCVKVHSLPLVHFSHSCALLLKCTQNHFLWYNKKLEIASSSRSFLIFGPTIVLKVS